MDVLTRQQTEEMIDKKLKDKFKYLEDFINAVKDRVIELERKYYASE